MHPSLLPLLLLGTLATSDDWPGWRGPGGNAIAPGSPPVEWSEESNVRWKVPLPGKGLSCPIVWGDRIFVTTAVPTGEVEAAPPENGGRGGRRGGGPPPPPAEHEFLVIALDRTDGSVLWERSTRIGKPPQGTHSDGSFATATPVTDGEHLIASFGSNGIYGLTLEGELLWEKDLGDMDIMRAFGEGSSPVLAGGNAIVIWDHEGESFIVALDVKTGEEKWRVERPSGTSWTTPLVVEVDGKQQVIVGNTQSVAYDPGTGAVIWKCGPDPVVSEGGEEEGGGRRGGRGGGNRGVVSSPVFEGGLFVTSTGSRRGEMRAIDVSEAKGHFEDGAALAWSFEADTPYIPSPIAYDGIVYVLKGNGGQITTYDILSGETIYGPSRMEALVNAYASPVAAGGHIYFVDREGMVEVLQAGREYKVLHVNSLDEGIDCSPAVVGDELFLRGREHLYCIAAEE